jgi:hypothetical protein
MFMPAVVFAFQATVPSPSQRGLNLFNDCKALIRRQNGSYAPKDVLGAEECSGYFAATAELESGKSFCLKDHYSIETLARIYVVFIEKNPKYLDVLEAEGAVAALKDAYPCGQ